MARKKSQKTTSQTEVNQSEPQNTPAQKPQTEVPTESAKSSSSHRRSEESGYRQSSDHSRREEARSGQLDKFVDVLSAMKEQMQLMQEQILSQQDTIQELRAEKKKEKESFILKTPKTPISLRTPGTAGSRGRYAAESEFEMVKINQKTASRQAKDIARHNLTKYDGKGYPSKLETWIREVEKVFTLLKTPPEYQVDLAAHYLTADADDWWVRYRKDSAPMLRDEEGRYAVLPWDSFVGLLRQEFFRTHARSKMLDEYLELKQDTRNVYQYFHKFMDLAKYVDTLPENESMRAHKFIKGVNMEIREYMRSGVEYDDINAAYDAASAAEKFVEDLKASKKRKDDRKDEGTKPYKKPFQASVAGDRMSRPAQSEPTVARGSTAGIVCHYCDKPGHKRTECRKMRWDKEHKVGPFRTAQSHQSIRQDKAQGSTAPPTQGNRFTPGTTYQKSAAVSAPASGGQTTGRLMALQHNETEIAPHTAD